MIHLEGDGFKLTDDNTSMNQISGFLGMHSIWDFKFSCAPLLISITDSSNFLEFFKGLPLHCFRMLKMTISTAESAQNKVG